MNVLGIGTKNGAPIKLTNGELLKDSSGAIVIPKLSKTYLKGVASRGHGTYRTITNDLTDINALVNTSAEQNALADKRTKNLEHGDQWHEMGAYLVLFILPLVLIFFRRGIALSILPLAVPLTFLMLPSGQVHASIWSDLWQTKDQQAQEKFNKEDYLKAAEQFQNANWQGSAYYKAGEFEKALGAFEKDNSANGLYNQGNALAQLKKIDEAIEAYKKALELDPTLADAKENKEKLEALKKQQEQQQKSDDQQNQDKNEEGEQQESDSDSEQQQSQDQKDSEQQEQDQQSEQQKSDQQNKEKSEQSEQKESESEQEKDKKEQQTQQKKDEEQADEQQNQMQQLSAEEQQKLDQELEEKHLQIMNKVTDNPYLLLRNKMQLEYKKRRQQGYRSGVNKQW